MQELSMEEKMRLLVLQGNFNTTDLDGKCESIVMCDGPSGIRKGLVEETKNGGLHCYPSAHVLANSWDRDIVYKVGEAIASDCIDNKVDIILGPGVNIKRTPLCGRNFEYYSEDPYLTGELASEYIKGCQDRGVGTSLKHFCANNREYDRCYQCSEVDLRTLREIYTKAFEIIIDKVSPFTIMGAYNAVNGTNVSENEWLLKGVLRGELHYDGVIISDWGAVKNRAQALRASLDIMCAYEKRAIPELFQGLKDGIISQKDVDESVERISKLQTRIKEGKKLRKTLSNEERYKIALEGAEKGCVLLKNKGNILPIKEKIVCFLGELVDKPDYIGGGSGEVLLDEPFKGVEEYVKEISPETEVEYKWLYTHTNCTKRIAGIRTVNIKGALISVYDSDVTVLVVGTTMNDETESIDRISLRLDERLENVILTVSEATDKLVVVVESGSAIDMSPWIDKVSAVLYTGFAGEAINEAIANILMGKTNPSGRLSETFPLRLEDTPIGKGCTNPYVDRYNEGVMVGYRHYVTKHIPVLFPFGYGLSYAEFVYSNFTLDKISEQKYVVGFDVQNVSGIDGGEVCQLYIDNIDMQVERPRRELRRFEKVYLRAGEKKRVLFEITEDCFAYFNTCYNCWHIDKGRYEIMIAKDVNTPIHKWKMRV